MKEVQLSKQAQNENKFCKFQTKLNENNKNVINGSKNVKIASSSGCQTDKNAELISLNISSKNNGALSRLNENLKDMLI